MLPLSRLVPLALAGAALGLPASATAAPPANDTFAGARQIAALPFSDSVDTTEATLDTDDQAVAAACGLDPSFVASNSLMTSSWSDALDRLRVLLPAPESRQADGMAISAASGK